MELDKKKRKGKKQYERNLAVQRHLIKSRRKKRRKERT